MLHIILFAIYISLILMVIFVERKRPAEALLRRRREWKPN